VAAPARAAPIVSPVTAEPGRETDPGRDVTWTGFASFFLIGWASLLLPSLIRDVEHDFGQSDGGIGLAYLSYSLLYVVGTLFGGILTERLGRRVVLPAGALLMAVGLVACALAPGWLLFVGAYVLLGVGAGAIDSGVNGLFMDLYAGRRSGALNRLHLFFAVGALAGPVAIGLLVGAGVPWRGLFAATGVASLAVAATLASRDLPHGRHVRSETPERASRPAGARLQNLPLPLIALAVAIGCYIPSEMGVSNWLVRYLDSVPLEVATLALSLFWAGLAVGRLVSSFVADRMGAIRFTMISSIGAGVAIIVAVLVPWTPLAIACFAAAGFASGPVYPMIMSIAGSFYPNRTSLVSGILAAAAVAGGMVYPPLMGLISETVGLGIGMIGAGGFAIACAAALLVAGSLGRGLAEVRSAVVAAEELPVS
jgi:fucose permease